MLLFAFDADGRVTLRRGKAIETMGGKPDDHVGEILTEVFAHQPDLLEGIERVLRGETARWSFPAKGLYFSTTCLPMRDDAGNVVGGIGVAMDVTEQRAVEDEARSQAERFRRLLSVTSQSGPFEPLATDVLAEVADLLDLEIGLLANVEDGVYTCLASYNREGDPLPTGHAMPLGDTYCDLAVVADGPVLIEHMAESHHREHRCYQINGLEAYVGAPVRVSGQLVGAISFSSTTPSARAFTEADRLLLQLAADWAGAHLERSEQAAALRDSQEQAKRQSTRLRALAGAFGQRDLTFMEHAESIFATALDLLGLDIGILSRIEDDCYTVLACAVPEGVPLAPGDTFVFSDTYCSITLQSDDVVAIDHMERSAHRRHPCYEAFGLETYIGAPITSGGVIIGTLNFSSPEARSQPFDESDLDLVRLMADWLGAAHQREAQARAIAEARDEAQAANRAKSAFLAAMSHEIRTPMNAVIGFGDLLSTTLLTPQQQSYVRTIQSAGDRLIGLIDDILDFSKIEAGRIDVETAPLELEPLVVGALEQIAPIAAQKGIELAYSIQDQITTRVEGDEQRISQILLNLLSNAIKFTERGSVEVHVRRASGGPYRLSVHDTGIGIPADRLEQVFDAFVQADSSTSRRFGGTGLGLAISQRLAERLGGELTATSTPGRGSVFTLELPLAAAPEAGRVVLTPASTPLRDIRVALVDDDEAGRLALVERMQGWGMEVSHTADPDELLGWLDDGADFDIGVLDMVMPGTDGLLLAEAIRQRLSAGELPLIVLSSERETRHAPGLVVSTALKPVMPATLHALLVRALDTRADESASTETALRILIAEDEPENQMLAVRMLRQLGFDAEVAGSGVEVLDRVRQHPYDVILMDVMMPEMDGLEATRRLRSEFPADQQPRIIALTARAMAADREACIAAGMDGYISKPFRLGTLAEALRQRLPTAEA